MSNDKTDFALRFFVFDHVMAPDASYSSRRKFLGGMQNFPMLVSHEQRPVHNLEELLVYEEAMLDLGYEGLILRDPHAPYKMGRSTAKEGYLLKLKRFADAEAVVIGFEERMHNGNEATVSELGRTKRSSHAAGKTGRGDLGALVCRFEGIEFNVGTGFSDDERQRIWNDQAGHLGRIAKFKYFPVGVKTAPRHPVFLGWRDPMDM